MIAEVETTSLEQLESEIAELAAHLNAATCTWLGLVGEFDRREGWTDSGAKSCGHWLSWRCGIGPTTAREHLRVARCLRELPETRETFGRGELSYSQVRAITRVATADIEADLVTIARHATAAQLEVVVRAYRGVLEAHLGDSDPEHRRRFVQCRHDLDGSLLMTARLPAEEGALVMAALDAGRHAVRASAETTQNGDSADALVLMADTMLASEPAERTGGERYEVVVHVDVGALAHDDPEGACHLEHGSALHPETVRRLGCDASIVRILERDGRPLSVGRRTRSLPPALRRALRGRDGGCRFPGCTQRRFLHAHHIDHWARGGRTDLSNLIHLCAHHHRLVHEGGYGIQRRGRGELCFRMPDGRPLPDVPHSPRGDTFILTRRNRGHALTLRPETCQPRVYGDRLQPSWVVDGLVERDPRLRE